MLSTGKIAAILGVHPDTVRNYEKRGIIPRARRSPINGYRIWEPEDLDRIREIFLELTYRTDDGRQEHRAVDRQITDLTDEPDLEVSDGQ